MLVFVDAKPYHSAYFGRGTGPIFLSRLNCQGSENNLTECSHSQEVFRCSHGQDAGVQCSPQRMFKQLYINYILV